MNSKRLDAVEAALRAAGVVGGPMRIILPDSWGGPGFWETVPIVNAGGTELYPASQQPPQRPGEGCVSLPDDWGKNANPNWEPPEPE